MTPAVGARKSGRGRWTRWSCPFWRQAFPRNLSTEIFRPRLRLSLWTHFFLNLSPKFQETSMAIKKKAWRTFMRRAASKNLKLGFQIIRGSPPHEWSSRFLMASEVFWFGIILNLLKKITALVTIWQMKKKFWDRSTETAVEISGF